MLVFAERKNFLVSVLSIAGKRGEERILKGTDEGKPQQVAALRKRKEVTRHSRGEKRLISSL